MLFMNIMKNRSTICMFNVLNAKIIPSDFLLNLIPVKKKNMHKFSPFDGLGPHSLFLKKSNHLLIKFNEV